jgi:predicted NBD/HSP70 family sugar kinase
MRASHTFEELLFWHIYDHQRCLRHDLGDRFDASAATISRAVGLLLAKGLVTETAADVVCAGRKPLCLVVTPQLTTLLGLEIDADRVTAVVTDVSGALLGRGAVRIDANQGLGAVLRAGRQAVSRALDDARVERRQIGRLGVGHPGALDSNRGVCMLWHNVTGWIDVPLRSKLQEAFRMEVTLDDRSRAIALAERRTSPEDGKHPHAVYVQVGTGIGMGVFVDGRLYRGATQAGGEIGNLVIDPDGALCSCGKRGCVEAYATIGAVLRHVRDSLAAGAPWPWPGAPGPLEEITIDMVAAAAQDGGVAAAALERAGTALGLGVANVVHILNPSLVVLCGRLVRLAGERLLGPVDRTVRQRCVEVASRGLEIRISRPKKDISAVGCALLAAEAEVQRIVRSRLSNVVIGTDPRLSEGHSTRRPGAISQELLAAGVVRSDR